MAAAVAVDGDIPLRWVAVVESIDEDGKRCYWRFGSEGLNGLDAIQLHDYALMKEKINLVRAELGMGPPQG